MVFFENLRQLALTFSVTDLIDILVISVFVYYLILLVRETRAEQLIKGFIAILLLAQISGWLNLYTVNWVLSRILTAGFLLIIVVFQPEIRRAFERLGRSQGWINSLANLNHPDKKTSQCTDEILQATASLSRQKIGALIILEGNTGLKEVAESGTPLDALVTAELLINIFIPNTPLHDGAVIIRGDRIIAAGAFLPLTQNRNLDRELGTRHRAALGISERSDAFVVVVSEETGTISVCRNGEISRYMDSDSLRKALHRFYYGDMEAESLSSQNWLLTAWSNRKKAYQEKKKNKRQKREKEESTSEGMKTVRDDSTEISAEEKEKTSLELRKQPSPSFSATDDKNAKTPAKEGSEA